MTRKCAGSIWATGSPRPQGGEKTHAYAIPSLGILAMAMPKLEAVQFLSVKSGEVEFADGRRAPLPVVKGVVTYNPTAMPSAKTLRFPKVPSRIEIG